MSTTKTAVNLKRLAKTIRRTFIIERDCFIGVERRRRGDLYIPAPQWDGGYIAGNKRKPIWPKIAQLICDEHIDDAEDYVRYNIDLARPLVPPKPPMPNHLLSRKRVTDYKESLCERRAREIDEAVSARQHAMDALERIEESIRSTQQDDVYLGERTEPPISGMELRRAALSRLTFKDSDIAPLFAYCAAMFYGWPEIAIRKKYKAAYLYWIRRDAYDKAWPGLIPSGWRTEASALYEKFCEKRLDGR